MNISWIIAMAAMIVCVIVILACRLYIIRTFDRISRILELCLSGKMNLLKETDETRESKIAVQLRTITGSA